MVNGNFRQLTDWRGHEGKWVSQVAFLESGTIGKALNAFLKGEEKARQFEGHDGQAIGGRHFTVRLARLQPTPLSPKRCLVPLLDKDRKRVVQGKSVSVRVDLGGRRLTKKKKKHN